MVDGAVKELGAWACARAAAVNRKTPMTATWINTMLNRRPPQLPVMSSPQYFLSSVLIGSFPIIVEDIAALHTRPSVVIGNEPDRKSTRLNSSHQIISYAVFCLKKKRHSNEI